MHCSAITNRQYHQPLSDFHAGSVIFTFNEDTFLPEQTTLSRCYSYHHPLSQEVQQHLFFRPGSFVCRKTILKCERIVVQFFEKGKTTALTHHCGHDQRWVIRLLLALVDVYHAGLGRCYRRIPPVSPKQSRPGSCYFPFHHVTAAVAGIDLARRPACRRQ